MNGLDINEDAIEATILVALLKTIIDVENKFGECTIEDVKGFIVDRVAELKESE